MRFYKFIDIATFQTVFINPKQIAYYTYDEQYVYFQVSDNYVKALRTDFEDMCVLEGIDEY